VTSCLSSGFSVNQNTANRGANKKKVLETRGEGVSIGGVFGKSTDGQLLIISTHNVKKATEFFESI
jgi:hypothetical protein